MVGMADSVENLLRELWHLLPDSTEEGFSGHERVTLIVQDIGRCLAEELTSHDFQLAVSLLFSNNDDGSEDILHVLVVVSSRPEFSTFITETCRVIRALVPRLDQQFITKLACKIKNTCSRLYRSVDSSCSVMVEALELMIVVLDACAATCLAADMGVSQLASSIIQKDIHQKLPPTVHGCLLRLLGVICQRYSDQMASLVDRAGTLLVAHLKGQLQANKLQMPIVAGSLQGLDRYLHHYAKAVHHDSNLCSELFLYLKRVIDPDNKWSRRLAQRAGLELLANHSALFQSDLVSNYKTLFIWLTRWSQATNSDDSLAGGISLGSFLDQIVVILVHSAEVDESTKLSMLEYLLEQLRHTVESGGGGNTLLSLTVQGYGSLAAACAHLNLQQRVHDIFRSLLDAADRLFTKSDVSAVDDRVTALSGYVRGASAALTHIDALTDTQLAAVEGLALLLVQWYPRLLPVHQRWAHLALAHFFQAVHFRPELSEHAVRRTVLQFIIRTCSHPVAGESQQIKHRATTYSSRPVSYLDYLPLWKAIMSGSLLKHRELADDSVGWEESLSRLLYSCVMRSSLEFLSRLDLTTKKVEDVETVYSSTTDQLVAKTPKDFQLFYNLVDFLCDVVLYCEADWFEPWLSTFLQHLMAAVTSSPMISGHYKITRVCLLHMHKLDYFQVGGHRDPTDTARLRHLLVRFVRETVGRCRQFTGELQQTCLCTVLATPSALLADLDTLPADIITMSLRLGRSQPEVGSAAMDAIDRWLPAFTHKQFSNLSCAIPALNQYINTNNSEHDLVSKSLLSSKKANRSVDVKTIVQARLLDESELSVTRRRVLALLSSLSAAGLVADSTPPAVAWTRSRTLRLTVPLCDQPLAIWLDDFLPRAAEIALSSGSGQSKIAACELLHAITIFIIATGASHGTPSSCLEPVYSRLLPVVLRLAADPMPMCRGIFSLLVTQMVHWFSSAQMADRPEASLMQAAILDGLDDPMDTDHREVCTQALCELVQWTLKQQRNKSLTVQQLMTVLHGYLRHPDPYKRLGSTSAIHSLYRRFHADESIVNTYLMDTVVSLLEALARSHQDLTSLGTSEAAGDALVLCRRILKRHSQLFLTPDQQRRVPVGWEGATLHHLVGWLTRNCSRPQTRFRVVCREFISDVSASMTGAVSIQVLLERCGGPVLLFERQLRGPLGDSCRTRSAAAACRWLDGLLAAMDSYSWLMRRCGDSTAHQLLTQPDSHMLDNMRFFSAAYRGLDATDSGGEDADWRLRMQTLRCSCLTEMCELVEVLLRLSPSIIQRFWQPHFYQLLADAVFCPPALGFGPGAALTRQTAVMADLLRTLAQSAPAELLQMLVASLLQKIGTANLLELVSIPGANSFDTCQLLTGLDTLCRSGIISKMASLSLKGDALFSGVWRSFDVNGASLDPSVSRLASRALSAALLMGVNQKTFLESLKPSDVLRGDGESSNKRSLFILKQHADVLVPALLRDPYCSQVLTPLIADYGDLPGSLDVILFLVEHVAKTRPLRIEFGPRLVRMIALSWSSLHPTEDRRVRDLALMTLVRYLLLVDPTVLSHPEGWTLVVWYRRLLVGDWLSLKDKRPAIGIMYMMLGSCHLSDDAVSMLDEFACRHLSEASSEVSCGATHRAEYRATLDQLYTSAELGCHPALIDLLMRLLCRDSKPAATECLSLTFQRMMGRASDTEVLSHLFHSFWCDKEAAPLFLQRQLDVALLPALSSTQNPTVLEFFKPIIVEIIGYIQTSLPRNSSISDREKDLVYRQGCFSLLSILYSRLPRADVHGETSQLVSSFAGKASIHGNEMAKAIIVPASKAFREPSSTSDMGPSLQEYYRRYYCAIYNTLMTILTAIEAPMKYYVEYLFEKMSMKEHYIWRRILNSGLRYELPLDQRVITERIPVSIRQSRNGGAIPRSRPTSSQSMVSQFLAGSSMSDQLTAHDFNFTVVLDTQQDAHMLTQSGTDTARPSVELTSDDLNNHECMATMVALVRHINETVQPPPQIGLPQELPEWVQSVLRRLKDPDSPAVVHCFLVKLIINCESCFKPYASWILIALLRLTSSGQLGRGLNALIMDLGWIFAVWAQADDIVPDSSDEGRYVASGYLNYLLKHAHNSQKASSRYVQKLFGSLLSCWRDLVDFPTSDVVTMLNHGDPTQNSQLVAVNAVGVALLHRVKVNMSEQLVNGIVTLLRNRRSELYKPASEVAALMYQHMVNTQDARQPLVMNQITQVLIQLAETEKVQWITCLAKMSHHCPSLASHHLHTLLFTLPSFYGAKQILALEVLYTLTDYIVDVHRQIVSIKLPLLAKSRTPILQDVCLKIFEKASRRMSAEECCAFVPAMKLAVRSTDAGCRGTAAAVCISLRDQFGSADGANAACLRDDVMQCMLQLLTDRVADVRNAVFNHFAAQQQQDSVCSRLTVALLELFRPGMEEQYLQTAVCLVLGLASRSPACARPIFERALPECDFRVRKDINSLETNCLSKLPLFSCSQSGSAYGSHFGLLRATQNSMSTHSSVQTNVEPTFQWLTQLSSYAPVEETLSSMSSLVSAALPLGKNRDAGGYKDEVDKVEVESTSGRRDTLTRMLRQRFERDPLKLSARFSRANADRRALNDERRQDQRVGRARQVRAFRTYRDGDFPDTAVPYNEMLNALQRLALHDPHTASLLLTSLITETTCGLQGKCHHKQFVQNISNGLTDILQGIRFGHSSVVEMSLDVCWKLELPVSPELIVRVCEASKRPAHGIVLLEKLSDVPAEPEEAVPSKRVRLAAGVSRERGSVWTELTQLYMQVGDVDSAQAAFRHRAFPNDNGFGGALKAESVGNHRLAVEKYEEALTELRCNDQTTTADVDLCEEHYFKCLAELSRWDVISECLDEKFRNTSGEVDLGKVWTINNGSYSSRLLNWVILCNCHFMLKNDQQDTQTDCDGSQLRHFINSSMPISQHREIMERIYPEELACLYFVQGELEQANKYVDIDLSNFLRQWNTTRPGYERRILLQHLRKQSDIHQYLSLQRDGVNHAVINGIIDRWEMCFPRVVEAMSLWESLFYRRRLMASRLLEAAEGEQLSDRLQNHVWRYRLRLSDAALLQRNTDIAVLHLNKLQPLSDGTAPIQLRAEYRLQRVRLGMLLAGDDAGGLARQWSALNDQLTTAGLSQEQLYHCRFLESQLLDKLIVNSTQQLLEAVSHSESLSCALENLTPGWRTSPCKAMMRFGLSRLTDSFPGKSAATGHLLLSQYCSKCLDQTDVVEEGSELSESLSRSLVTSTLLAVGAGSSDARAWLPRLLLCIEHDERTAGMFDDKCASIPSWMFLDWLSQLFSYCDSSASGEAVCRLLCRLASDYPQAVIYPYLLSRESFGPSPGSRMRGFLERIGDHLSGFQLPRQLVLALQQLQQPRLQLAEGLRAVEQQLATDDATQARRLYTELVERLFPAGETLSRGREKLQRRLRQDVDGIFDEQSMAQCRRTVAQLAAELVDFSKRPADTQLSDYSDWLAGFEDTECVESLEIPGQYSAERRPLPDYHVRVVNFSPAVCVLASKMRPLRLVIRGSDAREHRYLVKCGEDTRIDQRIQSLFHIMNEALTEHQQTLRRKLRIPTYKVLPLKPQLGLIQWLHRTETLRAFMASSLTAGGLDAIVNSTRCLYTDQMSRYCDDGETCSSSDLHQTYMVGASRLAVVENWRRRVHLAPDTLLTDALLTLSRNPESFLLLRANLIVTHALNCAAGWVLGVGDRHLSNTLVSLEDGRSIGIDFSCAFGLACHLPVPEIVPFRLTPQLVALLRPLGVAGPFGCALTAALEAIGGRRQLLAATLALFVREPTVEWTHCAGPTDVRWLAQCRVDMALRKLTGAHPGEDLCALLETSRALTPQKRRIWCNAVRGTPDTVQRCTLPKHALTVPQQVSCLLELAAEERILGVAYIGWDSSL